MDKMPNADSIPTAEKGAPQAKKQTLQFFFEKNRGILPFLRFIIESGSENRPEIQETYNGPACMNTDMFRNK